MSQKNAQKSRTSIWSALLAFSMGFILVGGVFLFITRQSDRGKAPVIVPTGRSDATAVLDPSGFTDRRQREAYLAAKAIPAVLNQLYCWCHCRESTIFHHRSLLECFESDHASQCTTCMGEALLAQKMVEQGTTNVRQIQTAIDAQFGPHALRGT